MFSSPHDPIDVFSLVRWSIKRFNPNGVFVLRHRHGTGSVPNITKARWLPSRDRGIPGTLARYIPGARAEKDAANGTHSLQAASSAARAAAAEPSNASGEAGDRGNRLCATVSFARPLDLTTVD